MALIPEPEDAVSESLRNGGNQIIPINYGVIETFKDQSDLERLNIVYEGIGELIATYRPEFMGVETLYFNTNITTGIKVAQARGVILLAGYRQNVPIIPVTPLQVKQQMAGYGRATKKQVIEMVMRMMNITRKIDPDDAADALAIGLTAIYHVEHRSLFERKNDRIYKRNCFRISKRCMLS